MDVIANVGGECYGDVLRQGGGAAGLCIGDHLSVLLRDVAFARSPRGEPSEVLPRIPLASLTSLLNISSNEVTKVFDTTSHVLNNSAIHRSHVILPSRSRAGMHAIRLKDATAWPLPSSDYCITLLCESL